MGIELESSLDKVLTLGELVISSSIELQSKKSEDGNSDVNDVFFANLDNYLLAIEDWQMMYGVKISSGQIILTPSEVDKAKKLKKIHQELMTKVSSTQGEITTELGQVTKKSSVIKRYIDVLPDRVSMTRPRKG